MKLRNKKTGAIYKIEDIDLGNKDGIWVGLTKYTSLAEFCGDWEDVPEEPKEYWYIDLDGEIQSDGDVYENDTIKNMKQIGNYFSSREEVEKAVEKLKAWKRLKDKGLTFCGWKITDDGCSVDVETTLDAEIVRAQQKYITEDLDLLFGGEE